eukprot:767918-Hanusia_phi.AAC.1
MARTLQGDSEQQSDHMKVLHGELLEGILSFVNEEVDDLIDEIIEQDSLLTGSSKQEVGRIHCQSVKTLGISETSIIKVAFIEVFVKGKNIALHALFSSPRTGLRQTHSRLLAMVDAEQSLMPHLFVEIVHTADSISAVYVDFVPRTPNQMLPDEYSRSVSPILQNNLSLAKNRLLEMGRRSKESKLNNCFSLDGVQRISTVGQVPTSSSPFQILLPSAHLSSLLPHLVPPERPELDRGVVGPAQGNSTFPDRLGPHVGRTGCSAAGHVGVTSSAGRNLAAGETPRLVPLQPQRRSAGV